MISQSPLIAGLEWTGPRIPYPDLAIKGDTYPMTWADDDEIYTSAGDPCWGETHSGLDFEKITGGPTDYKITKVNPMNDYLGWGGDGPKPTGMICVNNAIYLAVQNTRRMKFPAHGTLSQHGSDAHIITTPHLKGQYFIPAFQNITAPMFPGNHFGGPAFINYGKNNHGARDNYVYAVSGDQWDNGSNLRLGRVPQDSIADPIWWEWVCAFTPAGTPAWSRNLADAIPVLSAHRQISAPDMVYLAGIERYLLFTWRLHRDFDGTAGSDLFLYEAPEPWGPFTLAHYEENWETQTYNPYCPRLPLKWVAPDGLNMWLQFSGSWSHEGHTKGYYRSNVRPFKLLMK